MQATLLTDLPASILSGKVSHDGNTAGWNVLDYDLEKVGSGRALGCGGDDPGPLTIRLGVTGRHRISFITRYNEVRARLSGDDDFTTCAPVHVVLDPEDLKKGLLRGSQEATDSLKEGWCDVEEVFWREDDLTGKDLIVDAEAGLCLMAIRLTPATTRTHSTDARWPIAVTLDSAVFSAQRHKTPDDLFAFPEMIPQDNNVKMLFVQVGCGDVLYSSFTDVGTEFGTYGGPLQMGAGEANMVENLKQYRQWDIDPVKALADYAHGRGWGIHAYVRLRGGTTVFPSNTANPIVVSRFYGEHPGYAMQDRNGSRVEGLSIAHPEVRKHLLNLYAELAGHGVDGISLCFIRGCPLSLYEPPVVEGFRAEHGLDPRDLRDDDPRWLDYTGATNNAWMREVKTAIGPDCKLSAMVSGNPETNRGFGLDVATWVNEGIVSDLILTAERRDKYGLSSHGWPEDVEYDYFQNLAGRESVRMWPMFYHWQQYQAEPERYYSALQDFMHAGADGYATWDGAAMNLLRDNPMADLARLPSRPEEARSRLLGKYGIVSWCGYRWNEHSPMEGW